jgi:hypothetical protein
LKKEEDHTGCASWVQKSEMKERIKRNKNRKTKERRCPATVLITAASPSRTILAVAAITGFVANLPRTVAPLRRRTNHASTHVAVLQLSPILQKERGKENKAGEKPRIEEIRREGYGKKNREKQRKTAAKARVQSKTHGSTTRG